MLRRTTLILLVLYSLLGIYSTVRIMMQLAPAPTPLSTLLAFGFALLHGSQRLGWKKILLLLGLCFGVSLLFESVGVATGLVYGPYHYTDLLGPKFLGLVPYQIAMAWFMMMYPSYVIASRLISSAQPFSWKKILIAAAAGGLAMTAWDLAMDPLMVATGHWVWDGSLASRPYFGVPLQNYWGWWLTTFVTFVLFLIILRKNRSVRPDDYFFDLQAVACYAVMGVTTVVVDLSTGLGGPALVGIFAMLPWVVIGAWKPARA